jgi:predicted transcriptional regulator
LDEKLVSNPSSLKIQGHEQAVGLAKLSQYLCNESHQKYSHRVLDILLIGTSRQEISQIVSFFRIAEIFSSLSGGKTFIS